MFIQEAQDYSGLENTVKAPSNIMKQSNTVVNRGAKNEHEELPIGRLYLYMIKRIRRERSLMDNYIEKITENVYGLLFWDESWKSFNNCYILVDHNEATLIDSGKKEQFRFLETAIETIGLGKNDITKFVATHGHRDHIGGIQFLGEIQSFIHNKDLELIPENLKNKFNMTLPDNGPTVSDLECVLLGHHTKGSVSLYHRESKALFCGDHICFFTKPLSGISIIGEGRLEREDFKKFISDWSQSDEMRKQHNFSLFIEGLRAINQFDAEYLCTGHGLVLKGNINEFISDLLGFE